MVQPSLPLDLIEEILLILNTRKSLHDEPQTFVKTCSLVCEDWLHLARKLIFINFKIEQSVAKEIYNFLVQSPHLIPYLHSPSLIVDNPEPAPYMLVVLQLLPPLRSLSLSSGRWLTPWSRFPPGLETALTDLVRSPLLTQLSMSNITELPSELFTICQSLKTVVLRDVNINHNPAEPEKIHPPSSEVKSLIVYPPFAPNWPSIKRLLISPTFSQIDRIALCMFSDDLHEHLDFIQRFKFHTLSITCPESGDSMVSRPMNLPSFSTLRTLYLNITLCELPWASEVQFVADSLLSANATMNHKTLQIVVNFGVYFNCGVHFQSYPHGMRPLSTLDAFDNVMSSPVWDRLDSGLVSPHLTTAKFTLRIVCSNHGRNAERDGVHTEEGFKQRLPMIWGKGVVKVEQRLKRFYGIVRDFSISDVVFQ